MSRTSTLKSVFTFTLSIMFSMTGMLSATAADITGKVSIKPNLTKKEYKKEVKSLKRDAAYKVGSAKTVDYNAAAKNIVVYIENVKGNFKPPEENPKLIQKSAKFSSPVMPVLVGTTVDFPNYDQIFHNIFSYSRINPFDLGLYKSGQSKSVTFDKVGHVPIYCSIHRFMKSEIIVLQNPYFAVTDDKGGYTISGIPPGTYTLVAWGERLPEWSGDITISKKDKSVTQDIELGFAELPKVE